MMCVAGRCEKRNDGRFYMYIYTRIPFIYTVYSLLRAFIYSFRIIFVFYLLIYKDLGYR